MVPTAKRILGPLTIALVSGIWLSGCNREHGQDQALTTPWEYAQELQRTLDRAIQEGASDAQIDTLTRWLSIRDTPYSDVEQAIYAYGDCLNDGGVDYYYSPRVDGDSYPEINVATFAGATGSPSYLVMVACDHDHLSYVSSGYQSGPGVTARRARDEAAYLPTAIACLRDHGVEFAEVESLQHLDLLLSDQQIQDPWGCTIPPYSNGDFPVP